MGRTTNARGYSELMLSFYFCSGGYGSVKAGINSKTGERVCCKLSHEEYEGTEAQRIEIVLQAGMSHVNIVDLKDIVYEPPVRTAPLMCNA